VPHDEANASRSMPGSMENSCLVAAPAERVAFLHEFLDLCFRRSWNAEPLCLHVEVAVQLHVVFVNQHRRTGCAMKLCKTANMVDMRVSADDGAHLQAMLPENLLDAFDFVARIDDDCFACYGIAEDRAIALKQPDRKNFVNQLLHRQLKYTSTANLIAARERTEPRDPPSFRRLDSRSSASDKMNWTGQIARVMLMQSPLIAEHREAGAKLAEYFGCALPAEFAGFKTEYRAARESVALFDTSWHAVVTLAGPDRTRYLNAILTNNILALTEGRGTRALLLNAQGHILAELEVYATPEKLVTLSHASVRERTLATLDKYIIMDDVLLEDLTDEVGSFAIEGPRAAVIVQQACGVALEDQQELSIRDVTIERMPCHFLRRSHFGQPGAEFIARRDWLPLLWQKILAGVRAHGGEPIGMSALNTLRLEARAPWFPADFSNTVIPHEAALEDTHISFTKGCYTGQEIVERVRSRGHVNRKRVNLRFSAANPPTPGTKLRADGADVGAITSAAFSPASGVAIGMGYARREHNAPGSVLQVEGDTATAIVV
jgi:folate-binding protein YgfZ